MSTNLDSIPRRARLDLNTPAELAIRRAMDAVEAVGADPLLTDAVILLDQARQKVADYVDRAPKQAKRLCANHMHGCDRTVEAGTSVVGVTAGGAELLFCSERCKADRNRG